MPLSVNAAGFLRARTLGFHAPRPGSRPSPRHYADEPVTVDTVKQGLEFLGLSAESVTGFDQCVSRRRVAWVERKGKEPLLLKWPDQDVELRNNYESVALKMLDTLDFDPSLRGAFPSLVSSDESGLMLALDVLDPAVSLRDLLQKSERLPRPALASLAGALSAIHRADPSDLMERHPEWELMLPIPNSCEIDLKEYSWGCGLEFDSYLRVMQRLEENFKQLHSEWRAKSLVHFDLRDDNILFSSKGSFECRIIDWELAGFGEPLYDLGYLCGYLFLPAIRGVAGGDTSANTLSAPVRNIQELLFQYEQSLGTEIDMDRTVQFIGVTLIVHASMRLQQLGALGKTGHLCLLYGEKFIADPSAAGFQRKDWVHEANDSRQT